MDQQTKLDIELLLNEARPEIKDADQAGDPHRFNDAGLKYGHIAHRVYLALDTPSRGRCYDREAKRVLLDPWTVIMRSSKFENYGNSAIDDPNFWNHADMVHTLCDYLDLIYAKELEHAGA